MILVVKNFFFLVFLFLESIDRGRLLTAFCKKKGREVKKRYFNQQKMEECFPEIVTFFK